MNIVLIVTFFGFCLVFFCCISLLVFNDPVSISVVRSRKHKKKKNNQVRRIMLWSIHNWLSRLKQYIRYVSVDAVFPATALSILSCTHTSQCMTYSDTAKGRLSRVVRNAERPPMVLPLTLTAATPDLICFWVFLFLPLLRHRQGALLQTAPHDPAGAGRRILYDFH